MKITDAPLQLFVSGPKSESPCSRCHGSGKLPVFMDGYDRETGEDIASFGEHECRRCAGTGVVTEGKLQRIHAGDKVRRLMQAVNLTIIDAANVCGMTPPMLSSVRMGQQPIPTINGCITSIVEWHNALVALGHRKGEPVDILALELFDKDAGDIEAPPAGESTL